MAGKDTDRSDAPAKTERQKAAEAIIALMAPGKELSQFNVGTDATGEPNMIVLHLKGV